MHLIGFKGTKARKPDIKKHLTGCRATASFYNKNTRTSGSAPDINEFEDIGL